MQLAVGTRLGDYTVGEKLASGHIGVIHEATGPDGPCTLRILRVELTTDEETTEQFVREARLHAKITHANVAVVLDVGFVAEAGVYVAMERLRGDTLAQRLAQGPLPEAAAIELARRIAAGIRAAHAAGIVHRDLTPANIFLEGSGPKLVGFGGKELPGAVIGTPAYLAPEQLEGGTSDERSDVYALGCILFEMLAGRPPFTGEPAEILAAKLRDAPPPRAPALADLVASMLARRPDQRPSMSAVIAALEARPSTFDVVSAWILLALPVLLLIYAIVVAHQTAEDRPIKPPAPKQLR